MTGINRSGAPVVPNASLVSGRLLRVTPEPDGRGSVWEIAVRDARDIEGMPNFAQAHTGKTISVYVHPELRHSLREGDRLQARVTFRGDERGGHFALVDDDVQRI